MNTAEKIFNEIDEAIRKCQFSKPQLWNESQFRKYYENIKSKWLKGGLKNGKNNFKERS
jgi:hypothetical protein